MKAHTENAKALQQLAAASKYNKEQINEVVGLYTIRKIERFDTANCIINNLASRGKQRQNKGLDKLEYYKKNVYLSRSDTCNIKAIDNFNGEYNSYVKYKKAKCKNFYIGDNKTKHYQIGDNSSISSEHIKHLEEFEETTYYESDDDELERQNLFINPPLRNNEVEISRNIVNNEDKYKE